MHPGVVLAGRAGDRLRLPCFHFGPDVGVLPAFGPFTGLHVLPRRADTRVFAVAAGEPAAVLALDGGGRWLHSTACLPNPSTP